jgi:hypothetical protein
MLDLRLEAVAAVERFFVAVPRDLAPPLVAALRAVVRELLLRDDALRDDAALRGDVLRVELVERDEAAPERPDEAVFEAPREELPDELPRVVPDPRREVVFLDLPAIGSR